MIARLFLGFIALSIGMIGVLYLYDPNLLLARYDLATGSAGMDNMLRSTYGGLFLASSLIFALGVFVAERRRDALAFVAIFMTGAALGRIVSIIAVGSPPATIMPLLYFEIVATVIAVVLYLRAPQAHK
ncbi:MAG: DUF4345 domain-containing protein [Hyphomonadaceae bacterium]|nr:DUF4345 domain-containing protein [Hyphomonadaceae bacterium]